MLAGLSGIQESLMNISDFAEASLVVQFSDTAEALALTSEDNFPGVFATSRMIALMEVAAARLMKPTLKSVGTL